MVLRRHQDGACTAWPLGDPSLLSLDCQALGLPGKVAVTTLAEGSEETVSTDAALTDGWLRLPVGEEAFRFVIGLA